MNYKKLLKNFILTAVICLLLVCGVVILIDPFYHYHKPVLGLKAVLTDKEYQCIGTLKNFDYDSVVVGSSVCENYNNRWFDEKFGVTTIKAIRSYGATADLTYFLNTAYENHDLKFVFYNIDPGALAGEPYLTFEETGCPMYLYDNNPVNDIQYLLNKDVLLEKIPYMISKSYIGNYDEGESYNWWQWKYFSEKDMIGMYIRRPDIAEPNKEDCYEKQCRANIELIENIVVAHPETEFVFFYPPYSILWWDNIYRDGDMDSYLYNMKLCTSELIKYDNVTFYSFIDNEEICADLNNYMDVLHFSADINHYIVDCIGMGNEITGENIDVRFEKIRKFADKSVNELVKPYEDRILVDIVESQP